jgi:hypothetical protein
MGQGQSGPQGEQGERGPKGDLGPPGPQGPPGTNASEDPQQVAAILGSNTAFISRLGPMIAKDNAIGSTVAEGVANNVVPRTLVTNALVASDNFRQQLINTMATDTRFRGEQGPPGSAFDDLSIQNALQPKSLWCADGQVCRIPTSAPGTYLTGDTVIQRTKNLYLAGASMTTSGTLNIDTKHGVTVKDNNPVDGPFLYGAAGGQLGNSVQVNSTSGSFALAWGKDPLKTGGDTNSVYVYDNLKIRGNDLALGYTNTGRGDSGDSLALVKDENNVLKINFKNNFVGGTRIESNVEIPGDKNLKIGDWTFSQTSGGDLAISKGGRKYYFSGDTSDKGKDRLWLGEKWNIVSDGDNKFAIDHFGTGFQAWVDKGGSSGGTLRSFNTQADNDIKGNHVYANNTIFVGARPWKIYSENNDRNGALVFNRGTSDVFKVHTDDSSQVQIGNWRWGAYDKEFIAWKDGAGSVFKIWDNGDLWRSGKNWISDKGDWAV